MEPDNGVFTPQVLRYQRPALQLFANYVKNNRVVFSSLFKVQQLGDCFAGSQIYVHSKLMIADCKIGFFGSANLNLRSLSRNRDSEIGVIVESESLLKNLQNLLWKEHVGFFYSDLSPNEAFQQWVLEATARTKELNHIFYGIMPSNSIKRTEQKSKSFEILTKDELNTVNVKLCVQSVVCLLPCDYLQGHDLDPNFLGKDYFE